MIGQTEVQYCIEALNGKPVPERFPEARDSVIRFLKTASQVARSGIGISVEIETFRLVQAVRDIRTPRKRVVFENLTSRLDGLPDRRPTTAKARPVRLLLEGLKRQFADPERRRLREESGD